MRLVVRLAVIVLVLLVAVIVFGSMAPPGSVFNDIAGGFARALRIRWVGPFA